MGGVAHDEYPTLLHLGGEAVVHGPGIGAEQFYLARGQPGLSGSRWGHARQRVIRSDAAQNLGPHGLGAAFEVEAETRLPVRGVGPVAGEAAFGEDWPDVAAEFDTLGGKRRNQQQRGQPAPAVSSLMH